MERMEEVGEGEREMVDGWRVEKEVGRGGRGVRPKGRDIVGGDALCVVRCSCSCSCS